MPQHSQPSSDLGSLFQQIAPFMQQEQTQQQQQMQYMYHQQQSQQAAQQHAAEQQYRQQALAQNNDQFLAGHKQQNDQFEYAKRQSEQDKELQYATGMYEANSRQGMSSTHPQQIALANRMGKFGPEVAQAAYLELAQRAAKQLDPFITTYGVKKDQKSFDVLKSQMQQLASSMHPEVAKIFPWEQINQGIQGLDSPDAPFELPKNLQADPQLLAAQRADVLRKKQQQDEGLWSRQIAEQYAQINAARSAGNLSLGDALEKHYIEVRKQQQTGAELAKEFVPFGWNQ